MLMQLPNQQAYGDGGSDPERCFKNFPQTPWKNYKIQAQSFT